MGSLEEFGVLLKSWPKMSDFTARQQLIWNVGQFAIEVDMGGVGQFLYNICPRDPAPQNLWSRLRETIASLEQIGAAAATSHLTSILPRLEAHAADDGTWGGFLAARGVELVCAKELEEYDELFALLDRHFATVPE